MALLRWSYRSDVRPEPPPAGMTALARPERWRFRDPVAHEVVKLLGVSLAGAEFGEQRLPGRVNFDYVYPTDPEVYSTTPGRGSASSGCRSSGSGSSRSRSDHWRAGACRDPGVLDHAASANQQVILDLHNYGRYYHEPMRVSDAGRLADVWVRLAREFRGHPGMFGYELMNEPHDLPDGSAGWAQICQLVTDAIRTEDTTSCDSDPRL